MATRDGTAACKRNAENLASGKDCKCVTFHKRGGAVAAHVWRCVDRKLRAHNKSQCRRGAGKSFKAKQFVKRLSNGKCPRR